MKRNHIAQPSSLVSLLFNPQIPQARSHSRRERRDSSHSARSARHLQSPPPPRKFAGRKTRLDPLTLKNKGRRPPSRAIPQQTRIHSRRRLRSLRPTRQTPSPQRPRPTQNPPTAPSPKRPRPPLLPRPWGISANLAVLRWPPSNFQLSTLLPCFSPILPVS
jgi:hypothetical protein